LSRRLALTGGWKKTLGLVIAVGLLVILFATSNVEGVLRDFGRFQWRWLPFVFALMSGRTAIRIVEWRFLLRTLGLRASWRHSILGILAGDTSQIVPGGLFVSNLVLKRLEGASIARSLPATWGMQILEALVSLLLLATFGVPGWWWIRLAAVAVAAGLVGLLAVMVRGKAGLESVAERDERKLIVKAAARLKRFLGGIESLLSPPTFLRGLALTVPYLALTFAAFYLVIRGLDISGVDWTQATVVYAFTLAIVNLNPLPTDLGINEGSGVSIFLANGVPEADGLAAMIIIRLAIVLSAGILTCLAMLIFQREVRRFVVARSDDHTTS
jgi:uncharacterized membrane protein YbhN (UPF0104 family)